MKKFMNDLTTGKDNETHDVVRVLMLAIVSSLVVLLWVGSGTYLYGYYTNGKPFDIQTFFTSTSTFALGVAAFIMGGAASILLKKDTEPDGSTEETTKITKGSENV